MIQFILTAGIWDSMPKWLATILLTILQFIDQVIYVLINWMYRVFILVSEVDIFKDGTQIQAIVNRIYVIVGIAMLFIFAYNLVLLIINPEGKQLGNMTKVIQNAIISVILIIFLPTIFSYLKLVQNHIVTENVIGNIILGTTTDYDAAENTNKRAGVKVALDIYSAFYHPVGQSYVTCKNDCGTDGSGCKDSVCYDYVLAYNDAYKNSNIADFIWKKELRDGVKEGTVEYLGIVSSVAGAFALWMFISFALDIGIRVGKLAFYEVVSPIPVMMRILPGDKMFDKWFKGLKDTYLSIFIRLIIIYTCMYFITLVPDIFANMWAKGDAGIIVALANVVIILGILQFAKDAPKLISDMFGGGGNGIKFGIGSKIRDNKLGMGAMGGIGAGFGSMAGNVWNSWKDMGKGKGFKKNAGAFLGGLSSGIGGFAGGARRGVVSGYKSDSFKGLGKNITKSKLDADQARDERDAKHIANRARGAEIMNGRKVPLVGGIIETSVGASANMYEKIKDKTGDVKDWIVGGFGNEHIANAISDVQKLNTVIKKGERYTKGTETDFKKIKEDLRNGGSYTFDGEKYVGEKTLYNSDGTILSKGYDELEKVLKEANRKKTAENYGKNAEFISRDLSKLFESLQDNKYSMGKDSEQYLANSLAETVKALEKRANSVTISADTRNQINAIKAELEKTVSATYDGSTGKVVSAEIKWDGLKDILSTSKDVLANTDNTTSEGKKAVVKREAIVELVGAIDGGMIKAADWNLYQAQEKDK